MDGQQACSPVLIVPLVQVQKFQKLGVGSAVVMAPGKRRTDSDVMSFAVPPITVTHIASANEEKAIVSFYLAVFNSAGDLTLPSNPDKLYPKGCPRETFKKTARLLLAEMVMMDMPVSRR